MKSAYLLFTLLAVNLLSAMEQDAKKVSLYQHIKQEHLAALPTENTVQQSATPKTEFERLNHELGKQLYPGARTCFEKACMLLGPHHKAEREPLDADVCNDLNLLVGSHKTQPICVANLIPTLTHVGRVVKCATLLQPMGSVQLLERKKESVNGIIHRFANINSLMCKIAQKETAFLSFNGRGATDDPFYQHIITAQVNIPYSQSIRVLAWLEKQINTSEFGHAFKELGPLVGLAAEAHNLAPGLRAGLQHNYAQAATHMQDAIFIDRYAADGMAFELIRSLTPEQYKPFMDTIGYAVWAKQEAAWATEVLKTLRENAYRVAAMQEKLVQLADFVTLLHHLKTELRSTNIPALKELADELTFGKNEKLQELERNLRAKLPQAQSSALPQWGLIKSLYVHAYEVMNACQPEVMKTYHALGQLDVMNASAQLHVSHPTRYTVPTFALLEYPWLYAHDYWNPFLDPQKAITNTIELDGVIADNPRTAIITGPNGKGKTTTTTLGLSLAIVFAHSLSIAPASTLIVTPCEHIAPMIKVETNIGNDESLFTAGAKRIGATINLLKKPGFKFIGLDEPGNGTDSRLAAAIVRVLSKKVGQNPHTLCVVTTHCQEPTEFAKKEPRSFANYQIVPGYKIEKGISSFSKDENSGVQLLEKFAGQEFAQEIIETMKQQEQTGKQS